MSYLAVKGRMTKKNMTIMRERMRIMEEINTALNLEIGYRSECNSKCKEDEVIEGGGLLKNYTLGECSCTDKRNSYIEEDRNLFYELCDFFISHCDSHYDGNGPTKHKDYYKNMLNDHKRTFRSSRDRRFPSSRYRSPCTPLNLQLKFKQKVSTEENQHGVVVEIHVLIRIDENCRASIILKINRDLHFTMFVDRVSCSPFHFTKNKTSQSDVHRMFIDFIRTENVENVGEIIARCGYYVASGFTKREGKNVAEKWEELRDKIDKDIRGSPLVDVDMKKDEIYGICNAYNDFIIEKLEEEARRKRARRGGGLSKINLKTSNKYLDIINKYFDKIKKIKQEIKILIKKKNIKKIEAKKTTIKNTLVKIKLKKEKLKKLKQKQKEKEKLKKEKLKKEKQKKKNLKKKNLSKSKKNN